MVLNMVAMSPPVVRMADSDGGSYGESESFPARSPAPHATDANSIDRDVLYAEFAPLVRSLIRQHGQDADMREDLAGEIYCRFCALLDAFDPSRGIPLRPYIVGQLSRATYSYARQQWSIKKREASWEIEEERLEQTVTHDPTTDWLAALAQDEASALLPEAMAKLPVRQSSVVIWRYYEERSFEEIAELLGVQPATARSLLRHGLNNLRKSLDPKFTFKS
jgi:RNA polymerase sigma factor (sigma-70 family)